MAGPDGRYQTKVGLEQGRDADSFFVDSDGYLRFNNTQFSGLELYESLAKAVIENTDNLVVGQGAGSTVFSVINVPKTIRCIRFSMTSNCADASAWLPSVPAVGREIFITVGKGSCASGRIWFSTSGCSLVGVLGSTLSGFYLYNSVASAGRVLLVATDASEWSVMYHVSAGCYAE